MIKRNAVICTSCTSLATTYQTLDGKNIASIHITFFLVFQEALDFGVFRMNSLIAVVIEQLIEAIDEVHKAYYFFIAYSDIARCFIANMHIVTLLN